MSRVRYLWLTAAVLVAIAAFVGGRALRPGGADESFYAYDEDTPPYDTPAVLVGASKGGFTGFGASTGVAGETIVSGRVKAVGVDTITLDTAGGGSEVVRITGGGVLRRIETASMVSIRPGMSVAVRSSDNGESAVAVLVLAEP